MDISQEAFDLIVDEEVSGKAYYEHNYRHPDWPGGASGVTIGIGYDCGYVAHDELRNDWQGSIPDPMITALQGAVGVHGSPAHSLAHELARTVDVPWEAAIKVFNDHDIPKWKARVNLALPNCDKLSPDCFGALVSLAYNRGASFGLAGDRYTEMRLIRDDMDKLRFAQIPDAFRSMKRLWPNMTGLRSRREHEAQLFLRGLKDCKS